jgi:hypothetical protein
MIRPSHRKAIRGQEAWIVFGGRADMAWQRLLAPGFRHCFAALRDDDGWLVLDPLSGCLMLGRIDVPADFDLPDFYRRAGLTAVGPFQPGAARRRLLPALLPMNCVGLCRAVLGHSAPFAITPHGLHQSLMAQLKNRKKNLTSDCGPVYTTIINGRVAPAADAAQAASDNTVPPGPAPRMRVPAFLSSRRETPMGSLFKAPKPVRVDPPAPPPQPDVATQAATTETVNVDTRNRARRGIQGTIVTSPLGVLDAAPLGLPRKSLLGE